MNSELERKLSRFTKTEQEAYTLAIDLVKNNYADKEKVSREDYEQHLRDLINKDILVGGLTSYQALRRNANNFFEIIEDVVTATIGENIVNDEFAERFVDYRNLKTSEKNEFYLEGGLLTVSKNAGGHWDTNRQFLDLGDVVSIPTEWYYVHIYEDLDRFLKGIISLDKLLNKIALSFKKWLADRVYNAFSSIQNALPNEFVKTSNSIDELIKLIEVVKAANGAEVALAGTGLALNTLATKANGNLFSDTQKNNYASLGHIGEWLGNSLFEIQQTLQSGTFNAAMLDTKVYIIPLTGTDKKDNPIKVVNEGEALADLDTNIRKMNDMSIDLQVQTKMGSGLLLPTYTGVFTWA